MMSIEKTQKISQYLTCGPIFSVDILAKFTV